MRFIPSVLAWLFKPIPIESACEAGSDHCSFTRDPVARAINEAVLAHERATAAALRDSSGVNSAIADLLQKLEAHG